MEFIAVIAVIIVLCIILGVKAVYILIGGVALIGLIYAASVTLLSIFFFRMLSAKKHNAKFSRIDNCPGNRFKVAYYIIDGSEYPNIFPEEGLFRNRLYRSDKSCSVLLTRNGKCVFDKFARTTCTIGFLLGVASVAAAVFIIGNVS